MQLIESKTLTSAAASIEFTSIPQDGTDLVLLLSLRNTATAGGGGVTMFIRPNGSTTNFSSRALYGSGSSSASFTGVGISFANPSNYTANTFSNSSLYLPNYSGSTNKSISGDTVNENNATTADMAIHAGLWSNTSAITSITMITDGGNLDIGSTISLYKITKGSSGGVVVS